MRPTTTPTDDVLPQLRVADLVQRVDVRPLQRPTPSTTEPTPGLSAATLAQAARRRPADRRPQLPLRPGVVGLRRVRGLRLGPVPARRTAGALGLPAPRHHGWVSRVGRVKNLLTAYRGARVSSSACCWPSAPSWRSRSKYFTADGSSLQEFGESASGVWVVHGWVFIIYVVVAFLLVPPGRLEPALHGAGARRRPGPVAHLLGRAAGRAPAPRGAPRAGLGLRGEAP